MHFVNGNVGRLPAQSHDEEQPEEDDEEPRDQEAAFHGAFLDTPFETAIA
jgi:hypothetical protein